MNRVVPRFAVLLAFLSGSVSQAVPVLLPGTILESTDAAYAALISVLGIPHPSSGTTLIGVDLASLSFDPNRVFVIDDAVPPDNFTSGLAATGLDLDAAGGLGGDGLASFATELVFVLPGWRISAPGDAVIHLIEPLLNDPLYTNKTPALPFGPGGPGFLLGTPDDVLGAPDAVLPVVGSLLLPEFGFYSMGSFGILGLGFGTALDRNANIGGTPFDFVIYDFGGTPDNALLIFDRVSEPGTVSLLLGLGLTGLIAVKRRWTRAPGSSSGRHGTG